MPITTSNMLSALLVFAQFVLIAFALSRPAGFSFALNYRFIVGLVLVVLAVLTGIAALVAMRSHTFTVMPEPRTHGQLCQQGPYRCIRHPMYFSVLLAVTGVTVIYAQPVKIIVLLLLILVLALKIRREEHLLVNHYGEDYLFYQSRTRSLIPLVF